MMKIFMTALCLLTAFHSLSSYANDHSPVGLWRNIDDVTGKAKALIRITEQGKVFQGQIEKLFLEPSENQHPICSKCEGALKDQPALGMKILFGFTLDGTEYNGGTIIDPDNGKSYKSKFSLSENGDSLTVRGYIGIPLIGRSQIWKREK
jgi:uncharacterized protein (DUF2147 family)